MAAAEKGEEGTAQVGAAEVVAWVAEAAAVEEKVEVETAMAAVEMATEVAVGLVVVLEEVMALVDALR